MNAALRILARLELPGLSRIVVLSLPRNHHNQAHGGVLALSLTARKAVVVDIISRQAENNCSARSIVHIRLVLETPASITLAAWIA